MRLRLLCSLRRGSAATIPSTKTKQLGIAGLVSDENEVYIFDGSDSEASASGAAPASLIESDGDETSPWETLEDELVLEENLCSAAQTSPEKGYDHVPSMPCVTDYKGEPHRPKTVPYNSHSWITLNACVARPVSRKELLQSPPARASMKAEWDRLRSKMVWDEDKVREWSDVAREAQKGNIELNFGYLFGSVLKRTRSSILFIQRGSLREESCCRATMSPTKIGKPLFSKIWDHVPLPWKHPRLLTFMVLRLGLRLELLTLFRLTSRSNSLVPRVGSAFLLKRVPTRGDTLKRPVVPLLRALYGHPDSGTMWEQHCDLHVKSVGFNRLEYTSVVATKRVL